MIELIYPKSLLNRSLVNALSATFASTSLQRLAAISSQPALKASRSLVTSEPKNSGASSVDHHGHVFGLRALYDALDGARAEVIGVGLLKVYADVYLGAFDCSNLIGRARYGQQRVLTESDIIREGVVCGRSLKVYPLYIKDPTWRLR